MIFKFQLPPPLPRPELGATRFQGPFRTDHDYTQMVQKAADVSNILQHLDDCMEYGLPLVLDMETARRLFWGRWGRSQLSNNSPSGI